MMALVLGVLLSAEPSFLAADARVDALYGLRESRRPAADIALELVRALGDGDEEVRETARLLLVAYRPERAIEGAAPEAKIDLAHELARLVATDAVVRQDPSGEKGLAPRYWRTLTVLTQDEEPLVRLEAQRCLEAVARKY